MPEFAPRVNELLQRAEAVPSPSRIQLLGIGQRIIHAYRGHISTNRRPRKRFPAILKTAGNLIYAKRFEAGLSKIALAAKIGVTKELIREWEADQRVPTEAEWGKLKVILQLDLTVTLKSKVSEEFRV